MGPGLGVAHLLIAIQGGGEHSAQLFFLVPSSVVAKGQTFELNEFAQSLFKDGLQCLDIGATKLIDLVTRQAQLPVPCRLRSGVKCTMPKPRVSLLEGLLQALPGGHEARFHVEHSPVQKLPADLRRALKQSEAVGIDQLQWQDLGKLGSASCVLAINANLKFTLSIA
ncbi:hypothetical protein ALO72_200207 [Pseudomonas syringae pv. delphinii]|nr:hypothetical protein ALO72_200207 [Pseudomonas syringae pv. delphinii]